MLFFLSGDDKGDWHGRILQRQVSLIMGRASSQPKSANQLQVEAEKKTARLRDLRLANEAASREAGTWGDMSVGEITRDATGEVFVYHWKGNHSFDPEMLPIKRLSAITADEHQSLVAWLLKYRQVGFHHAIVAWNLSAAEAQRVKRVRIAELKAAGQVTINNLPTKD
jgi:hypothetical protein